MKTTAIHALLALLTGAVATAQPPRGQDGPPPRAPLPLVGALDADHDKVISAAEIAGSSAALATLDANGDGQLTRDELRPPRPEGAPPAEGRPQGGPPEGAERPEGAPGPPPAGERRKPVAAIVVALDSDKDHTITAAEIAAAPAALVALDKNGDGELTPDEFASAGPRRKGAGPRSGKP